MASILKSVLGSKPLPAHVPGDEIYPTHFIDNNAALKDMALAWSMRFNDVLDADKLHDALWRLLEIGDWRKVGGRLRVGKGRNYEIHVPTPFTKERPPIGYTHDVFDMNLKDHPLGKQLPEPTEGPSIQIGAEGFRAFNARPDVPITGHDFTTKDVPQLSLHITSFNDATLVSLSWLHTLFDAMSRNALMRSWSLVLAGREDEVPPLLGAKEDILYNKGKEADGTVKSILAPKFLMGFSFFLFILNFFWDIFRDREIQTKTVFLPKDSMDRLRQRALQDTNGEFVSEGDVLLAWMCKHVATSQRSPRPITALSAIDVRPKLGLDPKAAYIQNAVSSIMASLTVEQLAEPVGKVALANREALLEQSTEAQFKALLGHSSRQWDEKKETSIIIGPPTAQLFVMSNWTKAKFFHLAQFGPAVIKQGESEATRANPPGTVVFHHCQGLKGSLLSRNIVVVYGKDHHNNYWFAGTFGVRTWAVVEKELNALG